MRGQAVVDWGLVPQPVAAKQTKKEAPMGNQIKHLAQIPTRKWCKGDLGIEIEVEGNKLPNPQRFWDRHHDGSLRGKDNAEYVFSKPLTLAYSRIALKYLGIQYRQHESVIDDSFRAGVHVHVNVQDLTFTELYNFISLYIILEEMLTKFCGETREGNYFCMRVQDAEYLLHKLGEVSVSKKVTDFYSDDLRYAAMNVKAVCEHGSLEFRAMRGTRDLDLIGDWAEMLLRIRDLAKTYRNPIDIVTGFSGVEATYFVEQTFGELAHHFKGMPNLDKMLKRGVRYAQDLAFTGDWS